jgi:hypothetical protein
MKLLIAGSRSITDFDLSPYVTEDIELIISGGAAGVDTLAEKYADEKRISKLIKRPNYKKYGKAAPLVRNREMVDIADRVLLIWDEVSRGTKFTQNYAAQKGKELLVITVTQSKGEKG